MRPVLSGVVALLFVSACTVPNGEPEPTTNSETPAKLAATNGPAEAEAAGARPAVAVREASLRLDTIRSQIFGLERRRDQLAEDVEALARQVELERKKLDSVNLSVRRLIEKKQTIRDEIASLRAEEAKAIAEHAKALDALHRKRESEKRRFEQAKRKDG